MKTIFPSAKFVLTGPVWAALAALVPWFMASAQAQTTGFAQTAAGPFDYNTALNWADSDGEPGLGERDINGIWDSTLTLAVNQTATFAADTLLTTGLALGYTGNFDLTFRSDGGTARTLTLGGNITVNPVSNRTITLGSVTAAQRLNVDLGGNRVFSVPVSKTLSFLNTVSGGNFTLSGGNPILAGGIMKLAGVGGAATTSNAEVNLNATLQFDSSTSGVAGAARVKNVTLKSGGKLLVTGNNGVNSTDSVAGDITADGSAPRARFSGNSIPAVTVTPGTRNALLSAVNLQRVSSGTILFRGTALGTNSIASATASSGNIQFTGTAPALVGGGAATGTNISIIPWALGGAISADAGSTFVTYTADNGIRPLNVATEFAAAFANATDNVRLTANTDVASATTANSLIVSGFTLSGAGTVSVTSGAVFLAAGSSTISAGLDFGVAEGIIGYARGNVVSGPIAGSGGLTVHGLRTDENVQLTSGASTYTGDTTILANAQVSTGFLPSGARMGNVLVYGNLQLSTAGFNGTINGLFGNGIVAYGNSGISTLAIGDNNATSLFTGTIAGNNSLGVSKIGAGTLTLTGSNTFGRPASILGGTLSIPVLANGGVASGLGSSSAAATNLVINGGTLRYTGAAATTDRLFQIGQATTAGSGRIEASGTSAVQFAGTGAIAYGTAGTAALAQTRTLVLGGTSTAANTLAAAIANNGVATNGNSAVSLLKEGPGTWVLENANAYTGSTTIAAGTLIVSGSLSGSTTTISNGASSVLGGAGFVQAVTTLDGTVAPGNVDAAGSSLVGTLTTANYSATTSGAHLALQLGGTSAGTTVEGYNIVASDRLNVAGSVNISGSDLMLLSIGTPAFHDVFFLILNDGLDSSTAGGGFGSYFNGTVTVVGSLSEGSFVNYGSQTFTLTCLANFEGNSFTGGNDVALLAIPEPGAWPMLLGGFGMLLGFQRSRRASPGRRSRL